MNLFQHIKIGNISSMENIEVIKPGSIHTFTVEQDQEGQRIDSYLATQFNSYSRSFFGKLIDKKLIELNNKIITKKSILLKLDDIIQITFPEEKKKTPDFQNTVKDLNIKTVYDHKHFVILNKPSNLVVHPPFAQSEMITLVDWILQNIDQVSNVGFDERPGIVHRLDKDTTGLIIIPKNNCAHAYFSDLFKERKIQKTYLAIVKGHPYKEGEIDFDIARNPHDKSKMMHVPSEKINKIKTKVRIAKTLYKVLEYFDDFSLVEAKPITGRTHQIRVHFASIGHPLLGDPVYGQPSKIILRHALHAYKLEFEFEGKPFEISQEPPKDFQTALTKLRAKKL